MSDTHVMVPGMEHRDRRGRAGAALCAAGVTPDHRTDPLSWSGRFGFWLPCLIGPGEAHTIDPELRLPPAYDNDVQGEVLPTSATQRSASRSTTFVTDGLVADRMERKREALR